MPHILICFALGLSHVLVSSAQETSTTPSVAAADSKTEVSALPAPSDVPAAAPAKPKKQVINFEGADLRVVLQAMAKQAGMSLIIPDDVKGVVTARLVDIPVERAMRTILESKGYSLIELDGVYQVKSKESIAAEPTKTEVFQFANASAKEAKGTVDKMLTKAGNAQLDDRSNTLVITDVPSNLSKLIPILKTLDTPTPQVVIETKLLETTENPTLTMGVKWDSLAGYRVAAQGVESFTVKSTQIGTTGSFETTATTTYGGWRPQITAKQDHDGGGKGFKLLKGFAQGAVTGGPFFPVLGQLSAPEFALTLSFLLQDRDTELLSSPKVITSDNKEAKIRIARQQPIPNFTFNQQTASFVISGFEFKDVGNILTVNPHVNKDEFITLDVTPEVSTSTEAQTFNLGGGGGGSVSIPIISVRTLTSRVMVKSGNTLALGGLLQAESDRSYTKVPFLGDIPLLGELFRSRSFSKSKRNLLIFITPTVIGVGGGTGYEDQYTQLKPLGEDDRFAYKKDFVGNAKPRDQFRTLVKSDAKPRADSAVESDGNFPASDEKISSEEKSEALERATTDKEISAGLNQDQLAPRLAPTLRE